MAAAAAPETHAAAATPAAHSATRAASERRLSAEAPKAASIPCPELRGKASVATPERQRLCQCRPASSAAVAGAASSSEASAR